jgi:hypothetical protein
MYFLSGLDTKAFYAESSAETVIRGFNHMTTLKSVFLLTALMILAATAQAFALTIDVCANAAIDARFDSTGKFFTAAAPIFPGGTIAQSATAIKCADITATPIGTFFTVGAFVAGLSGAGTDDLALVTWHFRIGKRAFDTIGPVQAAGGVFAPGQTYPQTLVGSTRGLTAANGQATVTTLDPSGFVFELKAPGSDPDSHHMH